MEMKMGDLIKTMVEKTTYSGDSGDIIVKKGAVGLVCEIYKDGTLFVEFDENETSTPCFCEYKEGEYVKYKNEN